MLDVFLELFCHVMYFLLFIGLYDILDFALVIFGSSHVFFSPLYQTPEQIGHVGPR